MQLFRERKKPGNVVRAQYAALGKGDIPGILATLDPDVIIDEPQQLPYGGVHRGRDVFVQAVLGAMTGYARVQITKFAVFESEAGVVWTLTGTLTAHSNGEPFPSRWLNSTRSSARRSGKSTCIPRIQHRSPLSLHGLVRW